MPNIETIFFTLLILLNAAATTYVHLRGRKNGNGITIPPPVTPSQEAMYEELLDIRSTQNKILEGMNKWLRRHGRTLQVGAQLAEEQEKLNSKKKSGMILKKWQQD